MVMKVSMLKKNLEITDPNELEQILKLGQIYQCRHVSW